MNVLEVLDCDPLEDFPLRNIDLMNLEGTEEEIDAS